MTREAIDLLLPFSAVTCRLRGKLAPSEETFIWNLHYHPGVWFKRVAGIDVLLVSGAIDAQGSQTQREQPTNARFSQSRLVGRPHQSTLG